MRAVLTIEYHMCRCSLASSPRGFEGVVGDRELLCSSGLVKESDVHSSESQLCFASSKVENHPCIKCQAPMMLSRINTARLDFDVRTFECFNCDNLDKVTIETKRGSALSA
jgi:hypothetical protein